MVRQSLRCWAMDFTRFEDSDWTRLRWKDTHFGPSVSRGILDPCGANCTASRKLWPSEPAKMGSLRPCGLSTDVLVWLA